jgi:hypothetical protein
VLLVRDATAAHPGLGVPAHRAPGSRVDDDAHPVDRRRSLPRRLGNRRGWGRKGGRPWGRFDRRGRRGPGREVLERAKGLLPRHGVGGSDIRGAGVGKRVRSSSRRDRPGRRREIGRRSGRREPTGRGPAVRQRAARDEQRAGAESQEQRARPRHGRRRPLPSAKDAQAVRPTRERVSTAAHESIVVPKQGGAPLSSASARRPSA